MASVDVFLKCGVKVRQAVIWLTGLSGAGKTTLARALERGLCDAGCGVKVLDGDDLRAAVPGIGFDHDARHRHILNTAGLAADLEAQGMLVVVSLISPYRESRRQAREKCKNFLEVYVDTPLDECERRDPKGLYCRARSGEIGNFTGISDVYEAPENPEIRVPTIGLSENQSADLLLEQIRARLGL